jgi:hypothetical protein
MGWKEAINTYPSSIVYEIHGPTEATSLEYTRLSVSQDILFNEISEVDCVRNVAKISVVPT